jgi:hypothetical protein
MSFGSRAALIGLIVLALAASAGLAPDANAETATFGKTSVGASRDAFVANRKRVNPYSLPTAGTVSQLSLYLEPIGVSGRQELEGVIYADSKGAPGALVAVSRPLTFESTQTAGWYRLFLSSAVELPAGTYWIGELTGPTAGVAGYRYDVASGARAWNDNTFTSGPSNPFGAFSADAQQMSIYATYTPAAAGSPVPVNARPPTISGTAQQGQTLTEHNATWTNSPTSFAYQWLQCNSLGASCLPIAGATAQTYVPTAGDVGHTLSVQETASNAAGAGSPATSAPTASVVPPAAPVASFTWFPPVPHPGEPVSLVSSSSDTTSPITGIAWDLAGAGPFQAGGAVLVTTFSAPGAHLVRLRVTNAFGLFSVATGTINVVGRTAPLMQPFPVVQIAGRQTAWGVKLTLLNVQQIPAWARITIRCKGRHCPLRLARRVAALAKQEVAPVRFRAFERPLRFGVTLEILVFKPGEIGKYTRFAVRRGRLPERTDMCLDQTGAVPLACPTS